MMLQNRHIERVREVGDLREKTVGGPWLNFEEQVPRVARRLRV